MDENGFIIQKNVGDRQVNGVSRGVRSLFDIIQEIIYLA